jgi:hypothetical protein
MNGGPADVMGMRAQSLRLKMGGCCHPPHVTFGRNPRHVCGSSWGQVPAGDFGASGPCHPNGTRRLPSGPWHTGRKDYWRTKARQATPLERIVIWQPMSEGTRRDDAHPVHRSPRCRIGWTPIAYCIAAAIASFPDRECRAGPAPFDRHVRTVCLVASLVISSLFTSQLL